VPTVIIERCQRYSDREVRSALERALSPLGGLPAFVKKGQSVLLKPNLLAPATADEAVTTHPVIIQEVARLVLEVGGKPFIGDSPSFGSARQVARKSGILDVAASLGIEVIEFNDPVRIPLSRLPSLAGMAIDRSALDADVVINLPKIKAHQQIVFTGAIKNMFGCVNGKRKAFRHLLLGNRDTYFGRMLVEVFHLVRPALTIADGIIGMEGPGPRKGRPRALGLVLAGTDGIALDIVLKAILGAPRDPPYLTGAKELGMGPRDLGEITVLGHSIEEVKIRDFQFPVIYPIGFSPLRVVKSVVKDFFMKRMNA